MSVRAPQKDLLDQLGAPPDVLDGLRRYRKAVSSLAAKRARLARQHPERWIAVYNDDIVALTKTLEDLVRCIDEQKLPRDEVIVQFLTKERRVMVM